MTAEDEAMATQLLIDRATEGLDTAGQADLAALLERFPDIDDDSFELAAAAVDLAYTIPDQPMPATLRARVSEQAQAYFASLEAPESTTTTDPGHLAVVAPFPAERVDDRARTDPGRWLGWLAAAACLTLVVLSWWPQRSAAPVQARAELIAGAEDLLQLVWSATENPSANGASGDIVWSTAAQTGFMRFVGLPVNDPAIEQYQLWIFDADQDERFPVDGGVFDVTAAGEIVVPIDPKLAIAKPTLFAITIEKPGGVVVSSRERLPLLAKVG